MTVHIGRCSFIFIIIIIIKEPIITTRTHKHTYTGLDLSPVPGETVYHLHQLQDPSSSSSLLFNASSSSSSSSFSSPQSNFGSISFLSTFYFGSLTFTSSTNLLILSFSTSFSAHLFHLLLFFFFVPTPPHCCLMPPHPPPLSFHLSFLPPFLVT